MAITSSRSNAGERLLPSVVDEIAASDPGRVFFSSAKTRNPADGFQDVTAEEFARGVDRCSWYLEESLGRGHDFPTLLYMGPQDLSYAVLLLAAIKTGYKLLLSSPRNTLEAHLSLLAATECNTFLVPSQFPLPIIKQILEARDMRVVDVFNTQHWIGDGPHTPYPYTKTFQEAKHEPCMVLHTSGSTGIPKPIVQNHSTFSPMDAFTALPSLGLADTFPSVCSGKRVYTMMPLFHSAGITMLLHAAVFAEFTSVLGPFPPSAEVANAVHVHGNVQHSVLAPTILVDLVKVPEYLENLSKLEQVAFGGGPLPQAVGDIAVGKTKLLNVLGTTECGMLPIQLSPPQNWAYMSVSSVLGHEYCQVSDELFEQVIVRDEKLLKYQGIFGTFPDLKEWHMKDLYSKHPTDENVWLYRGRVDDIIVLTNGEKLNPLGMESVLTADPNVTGALVTGLARSQTSLLVEVANPPTTEAEKEATVDKIWPSVQDANKQAPSYGRIHREMIIFTSSEKPMLRAGKGTIQRKSTVDLYGAEFDALYEASDKSGLSQSNGQAVGEASSEGISQDTIKKIIIQSTDIPAEELLTDVDLFKYGLDSLQVILVTKKINQLLSANGAQPTFEARNVYSNPTVAGILATVSAIVGGKRLENSPEQDLKRMQDIYNAHSSTLLLSARPALAASEQERVVLLTGSTGSLGSYVLDSLVRSSRVSKIYCLNRGTGGRERQEKSQSAKGLHPPGDKATFLDANYSQPYFGLARQEYRQILGQVTDVVHNAWQVDFNLSFASFAGQIDVVRQIIDFSTHTTYGARVLFISSVSAVGGIAGNVLEQTYDDWSTPPKSGYGQAKFVAERLFDTAAKEADVPSVILRVGQIAGPINTTSGGWPKQEWLPSIIASSKFLGVIPETLGRVETVDWVPVDVLGQVISNLALDPSNITGSGSAVYHAINPQHTTWANLLPGIVSSLKGEGAKKIETVRLQTWLDRLEESESRAEDVAQNPAIKILDFMKSLVSSEEPTNLITENTVKVSPTLAELGPVQPAWVGGWLKQWAF